jgi:hypothetical protein
LGSSKYAKSGEGLRPGEILDARLDNKEVFVKRVRHEIDLRNGILEYGATTTTRPFVVVPTHPMTVMDLCMNLRVLTMNPFLLVLL